MATFSEAICKHRILFPSIQHLAWLPQGRPQGKQKCGKNSDFGLTHWLKHRRPITRKLLKIDGYMMRGFGKHWLLSFHPCNILRDNRRGISRGNKNVGCGMWKLRFFALAVWITGKLFKIDGYMLRVVWQALNCLFIHSRNVLRDCRRGVPRANKKWRPGYVKITIFCNCGSNNWKTVVDRQLTH